MTSDLSITLVADPDGLTISNDATSYSVFVEALANITVIGATVSYGINKIPIANVHIASVGPDQTVGLLALCDFDSFRRHPVILTINTKNDCIRFKGIIDGNSISQQPGNLTASFIVKHNFTLLTEVYPRLIGGNASTVNKFAIPQGITVNSDVASNPTTASAVLDTYAFYTALNQIYNQKVDLNQLAIRFIINLCQILLNSQQSNNSLLVGTTENQYGNFSQLICALSINAQTMFQPISQLLSEIDASFTDGFTVFATDALIGIQIQNNIALLEDNMFSGLVRMLDEYGCVMVVANNKAFVVPNAPYLESTLDTTLPVAGTTSDIANVAYPADYENFTFNDVGENTIKGVFTVAEPMTSNLDWLTSSSGLGINGLYTEDLNIQACATNPIPPTTTGNNPSNQNKVFGNIEVKTVPGLVTSFMTATLYHKSVSLKNVISNGNTTPSSNNISLAPANPVSTDEATNTVQQGYALDHTYISRMQDYLNQVAQVEYCRIKYGDRTGTISLPFNNNWVPGAPGSLYTRNPGIRIDFFVTDVTHNFSLSPPNTGNATTSVTFCGGRPGASVNIGLPQLDLYQYSYDSGNYNAIDFCNAFLTDLTSLTGAPIPPPPAVSS